MRLKDAKEIIECLPRGRTRFLYFKDRYALLLLSLAIKGQTTKRELKHTEFSRLLDKAVVKEALSKYGRDELSADVFCAHWPIDYECYFLTLGIWGSNSRYWDQTSRRGHNLVLQLNFSSRHDEPYRKLIDPDQEFPFEFEYHPISKGRFRTLAWSRMDVDLATGEALIEEIQNDWVRYAMVARRLAKRAGESIFFSGVEIRTEQVLRYCDSVLRPHVVLWDEAMLSATVWFLREELGIKTIFYHTHASGAALKRISYRLPPRSLYTKLPRKFCFTESEVRPGFLHRKAKTSRGRRTLEHARFHLMSL